MASAALATRPSWRTHASRNCPLRARNPVVCAQAATLREVATGKTLPLEDVATFGSDQSSTVRLSGTNIAPQHARVQVKNGRVFMTATAAEPGNFLADTYTWLHPDTQLRGGVDYMVSPGAEFSFGELGANAWQIDFEEKGNSGMADLLMDTLAQQSSAEVRKVFDERK